MRPRRVPQRTCVGCHQVKEKRALVRVVRDPQGIVSIDVTGKSSGRGAYICPNIQCLEMAIKGNRLEKALESTVDSALIETLRQQLTEGTFKC